MSHRRWITPLLIGTALAVLAGCSSGDGEATGGGSTPTPARTVTAVATGSAEGTPDNLQAQVTIASTGSSASRVLTDNSTRTRELLYLLKGQGVSDKDVRTTSVSLGPTYSPRGRITGYQASNSVQITFRDLKTAGSKLDTVVRRAGDQARIDGVTLGFNDQDALVSAARRDAVRRAKDQANEMARAAGASIGEVRTISEVVLQSPMPYAADARAFDGAGGSVPIAAGSQKVEVQVKAIFTLG